MRIPRGFASWCLVALVATGCATNPIRVERQSEAQALAALDQSAVTRPLELSVHTKSVLTRLDLADAPAGERESILSALRRYEGSLLAPAELDLARAEIAFAEGQAAESESRYELARARFLVAFFDALQGFRTLGDGISMFDPRHRILTDIHNRALSRFLFLGLETDGPMANWSTCPTEDGRIPIRFATGAGVFAPQEFEEMVPAPEVKQTGFDVHHQNFGLGASMIGLRSNYRDGVRPDPKYGPLISWPVTAVLRREDDGSLLVFLHDAFRADHFDSRSGRQFPLASDFTAPLAWRVAHSNAYALENASLFDPQSFLPYSGLTMAQPYDPNRIPVILVHGLWSSPLTWIWAINEIWGDPVLRARYQVWIYAYPTGLPIVLNAARFREAIREFRSAVDPEGDDQALRELVVIGHSMGGLLTKTAIKECGDALWNAMFRVPLDQVAVDAEERDLLRSMFFPEPITEIRRVLYMATPHRGSLMAEGLVGVLGSALIDLPDDYVDAFEAFLESNPGVLRHPEFAAHLWDSIQSLSADSPILAALDTQPYLAGVSIHNLIGDSEKAGHRDGSDGVVPWQSAHQEGALSECVIHCDHSVPRDPMAWAEMRLCLRRHLAERAPAP